MDQLGSRPVDSRHSFPSAPINPRLLPSRRLVLDAARRALRESAGPILLTGEAGVGKTWLWRRLSDERSASGHWLAIEVSPATDPRGFYRLLAHALGLPQTSEPAKARAAIADFLREQAAEGVRWTLVVEEAHNLSDDVAEEVRVISNRLSSPDGFASLLIVGQTALLQRLRTQAMAAFRSRLSAQLTLGRVDIEEAGILLGLTGLLPPSLNEALEQLYAECRGNPRMLARAVGRFAGANEPARVFSRPAGPPAPASITERPRVDEDTPAEPSGDTEPATDVPILGTPRPPLREEDGVIEVGWEPNAEPEAAQSSAAPASPPVHELEAFAELLPDVETEESIDDHYAALRAWSEWAKNQGRAQASADLSGLPQITDPSSFENETSGELDAASGSGPASPTVWAEGQQGFAPYSQLFSRLRQSRDSKS